jgi:hypothetical protein
MYKNLFKSHIENVPGPFLKTNWLILQREINFSYCVIQNTYESVPYVYKFKNLLMLLQVLHTLAAGFQMVPFSRDMFF